MATATPNIDVVSVLRLIEARLETVANISIQHLGTAPREEGRAGMVARVSSLELGWDRRNSNANDGDYAGLVLVLALSAPSDMEGGALLTLGRMLNGVKAALDRQTLGPDATTHRVVMCQVRGMAIVDSAQPGSSIGEHAALGASVRIEAEILRTSGMTVETLPIP